MNLVDEQGRISTLLEHACHVLEMGDLKLFYDSDGVVHRLGETEDLVGWIGKRVIEDGKVVDRMAVGFYVTNNYEEDRVPLHTFQHGLELIVRHFDEWAEHFPEGGELPQPKIALLI